MLFRILLVDDEPHVVDSIQLLLQAQTEWELDVYVAHRGRGALDILQNMRVDLLITDIQMPDMTGLELISQTKARWPDCEAFVLTGYSHFEYAYEAIRLGTLGFILKSEKDEVLLDAVRGALEKIERKLHREQLFTSAWDVSGDESEQLDRIFLASHEEAEERLALARFAPPFTSFMVLCAARTGGVSLNALDSLLAHYLEGHVGVRRFGRMRDGTATWLFQCREPLNLMWLNGTLEAAQASVKATVGVEVSLAAGMTGLDGLREVRVLLRRALRDAGETASIYTLDENVRQSGSAAHTVHFLKCYIDKHLTDDLSLLVLSSVTGYNPDYLARVFRQITGETVGRYITARRLHRISMLMAEEALGLEEIARMAGFTSLSYFNRFLKREVGLTPKAFRAQLSQQRAEGGEIGKLPP